MTNSILHARLEPCHLSLVIIQRGRYSDFSILHEKAKAAEPQEPVPGYKLHSGADPGPSAAEAAPSGRGGALSPLPFDSGGT